jgi:hypothetical protein
MGSDTEIPIMEVYKSESQKILQQFFDGQISGAECIAAMDAAIIGLASRMDPADLPILKELMLRNNERVIEEANRRTRNRRVGREVAS